MILFYEDWERFPTATPDYTTSNESFKRMVKLYKDMGIRNHAFPLALLQPDLKGVNPHDPKLSEELKLMVAVECKYNPWYYFREVVRIPPKAGPTPVPFKANRGNIALIWCFFSNIDIALIQPRQTGKSVSTDCLMDLLIFIMLDNTTINMITKDDSLRRANIERLKAIRDLLPPYLVLKTKDDSDNQIEITCISRNNRYQTGVSQNSERAANNLARGFTVPINHIDEGPFINYIGVTLPAALASAGAARDEAARNGTPYGNIFTTTAGKKDDRDGKFMYDFIHSGAVWNEKYFDAKDKDQLRQMVLTNCTGRKVLINATFSHRQLGYTDEWLYEKVTTAGATGEAADRDFFNVWTSGTQSSPLSTKLNEIIRDSEIDPEYNEITKENYILRWYIPEEEIKYFMESTHCVIGIDSSDAIGRDSIGMVVSDIRDMSTVAALTINETNLMHFAKFLAKFMVTYKNTTLIIEKRSSGQALIDSLIVLLLKNDIDPFKRIYNRIVDDKVNRQEEYRMICTDLGRRPAFIYDKYKKYFGFNTTGGSRDHLYSVVLQNAAKRAGHLVKDRTLSTQIRGLVVRKGRIDHEASGNDDMVIAWLLNEWMLTHSTNLEFYGIDNLEIHKNKLSAEDSRESEEKLELMEEQEKLRAEIEEIYEQLKTADDDFIISKLEHRLRLLNSRVADVDDDSLSIDALIRKAKESREWRTRMGMMRSSRLDPRGIWGR